MKYLLDTDTCIFALRDDSKVLARLLKLPMSHWGISSLTACELERVAVRATRPDVAEQTSSFVDLANVLPFRSAEAKLAATVELGLRKNGTPNGLVDTLLAAHAISLGLTLVTNNTEHFKDVPGLKLENWL